LTEVASLKVCGSKSSKDVVISTPAAKAPRTPMFFLRLAAKVPPNNVEKQVTTAKRTALKFIQNYVSDSGYLIFIFFGNSLLRVMVVCWIRLYPHSHQQIEKRGLRGRHLHLGLDSNPNARYTEEIEEKLKQRVFPSISVFFHANSHKLFTKDMPSI
jgi:hypothetical protein